MGSDALSATHSAVEDAQPGLSTDMRLRAGCMESTVVIEGKQTACVGTCENLQELKRPVVTGIDNERNALVEETTVRELLEVLHRRAGRLVTDRIVRERLFPVLTDLVTNLIVYLCHAGELDNYVLTNIMTSLATADSHDHGGNGQQDYSTFIRRLNPADPESWNVLIIGRSGRIHDPDCPLREMETDAARLSQVPRSQLHVFRAYHHARSMDVTRGAPRIPVEDFLLLVPEQVKADPVLEEALLDVCFSDGAWELYQRRIATRMSNMSK